MSWIKQVDVCRLPSLVVIDPLVAEDSSTSIVELLAEFKQKGILVLAYLSIGEAEDYRPYWRKDWSRNRPSWLAEENPEWPGNYAVKYWDKEWKDIVTKRAKELVKIGFSGLYLDKVDEFEYWAEKNPERELFYREEMVALITEVVRVVKRDGEVRGLIVPQNGESLVRSFPYLVDVVDGWAVEDLFYNGRRKVSDKEVRERLNALQPLLTHGKFVLSVDYVWTGKMDKLVREYIEKCKGMGFSPYPAWNDRELNKPVWWWCGDEI